MSTHDPNLRYPALLNEYRWCANGTAPDGKFLGAAANAINHCVAFRRKLIAEYFLPADYIPAGAAGTNAAWYVHCHTGVGTDKLVGVFCLAPADNGTDPYVDMYIEWSGDNATSGAHHYGAIKSSAQDKPDNMTWGVSVLANDIPEDTDCEISVRLSDYARVHSFCIYEIGNVPVDTTESGVDPRIGVGSPVYDDPIEAMVMSCSEQWRHNAGPIFQWLGFDNGTTRRSLLRFGETTYVNIFDGSTTTVSASSIGFRVNLAYHNSANQDEVPVVVAAYMDAGCDEGNEITDNTLRLTDGTNTIDLPVEGSPLAWVTTTATMPATDDQKWDIHCINSGGGGSDQLRIYSVCVYELD